MTDDKTLINLRALEPRTLDEAATLARYAVASRLYSVSSPEAALMILLTGKDLGLTASQSLRAVYVVNGKPVVSSDAMVAAIRRSGLAASWRVVETTVERCTITTKRVGEDQPESETFTLDDAKRAGLDRKDVWRAYPRDMLRHRCAAALARRVYPDVILGCYAPGELDEPAPVDVRVTERDRTPATSDAEYHAERPVLEPAPPHREDEPPPEVSADHPAVRALLDALEQTATPEGVVLAWLEHSDGLASHGSGVLHKARALAAEAWTGYGGADGQRGLAAAVRAAREAVEGKPAPSPEPAPKARKRAPTTAPLVLAVETWTPFQWRASVERDTSPGHVAGGYHKRAAAWREAGTLAACRAITLDRLAVLLGGDEARASAFLDGCAPRSKG